MIEICNNFLVKILLVVYFCDAIDGNTENFDVYKTSELFPDIYNIYKEAVAGDEETITRRILRDRKFYTIHISKLKDVNGIKSHNLLVTDDTYQAKEPLVYINNPVESHLPYTYLTQEQFKNDMLKKLMQQRDEFEKQKLTKYLSQFKLFDTNAKRIRAVVKNTMIPQAEIVLKEVDMSKLSRTRKPKNKTRKHKHGRSTKKRHRHHRTFADTAVTEVDQSTTDYFTTEEDASTGDTATTNKVVETTITSCSKAPITTESNLPKALTKISVHTTSVEASTTYVTTPSPTSNEVISTTRSSEEPSTITEKSLPEVATTVNVATTSLEDSVTTLSSTPTEIISSTVYTDPVETTMATTVTTANPSTTATANKTTKRTKPGRPYVFLGN